MLQVFYSECRYDECHYAECRGAIIAQWFLMNNLDTVVCISTFGIFLFVCG
jgi:hypothetical protein